MQEMKYEDGDFAPPEIIDRWLALVDAAFAKKKLAADHDPSTVAVHCVAGSERSMLLSLCL